MNVDLTKKVYEVFDPAPLEADDQDRYVDLTDVRGDSDIVNSLANTIRLDNQPTCQLLAGHRGSGKSTELYRLQCELERDEPRYFAVFCLADEDIDRNDVDFPDVLVMIIRQLAAQLRQRAGISLKPGYFRDRWERIKHLLGSEVTFEGLELDAGMLKVAAAIKSSPDARLEIRKLLEPDTSNWLDAANDIIGEAKQELIAKGYNDLVIIVDDLDKMVLRPHADSKVSTAEYLFVHREGQLAAFQCHLVYTIPLALAYSAQGQIVESLYGGSIPVMPMTRVRTRPPTDRAHSPGMRKFRDLIAARLQHANVDPLSVFGTNAVRDKLIRMSGGQPRELMILAREAIVGDGLPVGKTGLDRAARESNRAYARQLRAEHWEIIEQVAKNGELIRAADNDALIRDLLDSRAVLQYRNDDEWYAPNPLLPSPPSVDES